MLQCTHAFEYFQKLVFKFREFERSDEVTKKFKKIENCMTCKNQMVKYTKKCASYNFLRINMYSHYYINLMFNGNN